ncbi:MAG: SagB/ThcOx family dehydrogenase [bacterium]|nr:SagB/ThcOx family dehydrogenase [bacterium]
MTDSRGDAFHSVVTYHEITKHYHYRHAASLGYMDWDTQPDPFRLYEGVEVLRFPFITKDSTAPHLDLYRRGNNRPEPFGFVNLGRFMELSMGLSAWKSYQGEQWPLRMNPSSGNLHPTEAHLAVPSLPGIKAGAYHYSPYLHGLERRAALKDDLWQSIRNHFGCEGFLVGLTSIFWRESWKYGERAFRYCNHDVGHALAALSVSANLMGWKMVCLNGLSDDDTETVLGLKKTAWHPIEEEHPDIMCFLFPYSAGPETIPWDLPGDIIRRFDDVEFKGIPNKLSSEKMKWEIIYQTAEAARKGRTPPTGSRLEAGDFKREAESRFTAAEIIRKRRSGVDYDSSRSQMEKQRFLSLLDKTLPRGNCAPFDLQLQKPCIHLLIFVHRVTGLEPGLYAFVRNPDDSLLLKEEFHSRFAWEPLAGDFPLFLLEQKDCRGIGMGVSCDQEIGGDGAFSLGMIANFSDTLGANPFRYRHLFWEAGMVGQVLYLESEANDISGTGIGCFYDDEVHQVAGLRGNRFQSLYHFAVGTALRDSRLTTFPPYFHLKGQATGVRSACPRFL